MSSLVDGDVVLCAVVAVALLSELGTADEVDSLLLLLLDFELDEVDDEFDVEPVLDEDVVAPPVIAGLAVPPIWVEQPATVTIVAVASAIAAVSLGRRMLSLRVS